MVRACLLIHHDFPQGKYHPDATQPPYEYTSGKLQDELTRLNPDFDVVRSIDSDETNALIGDVDYMVAFRLGPNDIARARHLRWIHILSAGPDHFFKRSGLDPEEIRERGIIMTTSAGAGAVVIAEQVLAYMLMFSRDMLRAVRQHDRGEWKRYAGLELAGATLGIVGLGAIGSRVAHLARAFGMYTIATKRDPNEDRTKADEVLRSEDYPELLRRSDYVLLSCPLTDATRHFVNERTLAMMKPNAYLMNVARGECVDERALVAALRSGGIAGYAGDNHGEGPERDPTVHDWEELSPKSALWTLPNVIVTPNSAVAAPHRYRYMAEIIVDNHRRLVAGESPSTPLYWNGKPITTATLRSDTRWGR